MSRVSTFAFAFAAACGLTFAGVFGASAARGEVDSLARVLASSKDLASLVPTELRARLAAKGLSRGDRAVAAEAALDEAAKGLLARNGISQPTPEQARRGRHAIAAMARVVETPSAVAVSLVALNQCGDESRRCVRLARAVFETSSVLRGEVERAGAASFDDYVRAQPSETVAVFRAEWVARAEYVAWKAAKLDADGRRAFAATLRTLAVALKTGRLPRLFRAVLDRPVSPTQRLDADGPSGAAGDDLYASALEGAASPDAAKDVAAKLTKKPSPVPIHIGNWARSKIVAQLREVAEIVTDGVPLGGGVTIKPDRIQGNWGLKVMGVFLDEEDTADPEPDNKTEPRE